jgi:multidrug efflux pump
MAISIMGGLMVATVLTLFFLPALYTAWFRVRPDDQSRHAAATGPDGTATKEAPVLHELRLAGE